MKIMVYEYEIEYGDFLYKFLGNVTDENFIWHITDDDVIKGTKWLFEKEDYTAEEFINLIRTNESYAIFCNIRVYKNNGIKNIDKDKSFLNNDFEIKIIITDNMFIELYCNNEKIYEILKNNLDQMGAKKLDNKILETWY